MHYQHLNKNNTATYLLLLILPFVILYWLNPLWSGLTIGNDYVAFPIEQQLDLQYSLENDTFPLYAPGFAGGQSAAAMTLGQLFHPLSHIAALLPGYWDGYALDINTTIRLFSLGACHILIFMLLRTFGLGWFSSFLISLLTIYNFRMIDHFRYGASLENHTAFLCLSASILFAYMQPQRLIWPLLIALSSYLLIVGGHPQVTYIALLSAASITLIAPFFIGQTHLETATPQEIFTFWIRVLIFTCAGLALAAPYALNFYFDFVELNSKRTENPYEWSLAYQDSWSGILRNYFAPLRSDVSSAFGSSPLILLTLFLPLLRFAVRIPWSVYALWGFILLITLISMGSATPLHKLTWEYFPLASNFRVPGRYSLMLTMPFLLSLALLAYSVEQRRISARKIAFSAVLFCIACTLAFLFIVDPVIPPSATYTPAFIRGFNNSVLSFSALLSLISLVALSGYLYLTKTSTKKRASVIGFVCICFVISITYDLKHATWIVERPTTKTLEHYDNSMAKSLNTLSVPGYGLSFEGVDEQIEKSILNTKLARLYTNVKSESGIDEYWKAVQQESRPDLAIVLDETQSIAFSSETSPSEVELQSANFNQLNLNARSSSPGILSTNIPYRDNWEVIVNGLSVPTFKANGNELAFQLDEGESSIQLRYDSPYTNLGIAITCTALWLLIIYTIYRVSLSQGWLKGLLMLFSFVLPALLYISWNDALYDSGTIDTNYYWSSKDIPDLANLAYAKPTSASSIRSTQMPYYYYPGLAVDGDHEGRIFQSRNEERPFLNMDLGKPELVDIIRVSGLQPFSDYAIWAANDDNNYFRIGRVSLRNQRNVMFNDINKLIQHVAIEKLNPGMLTVSELEVFAPQANKL